MAATLHTFGGQCYAIVPWDCAVHNLPEHTQQPCITFSAQKNLSFYAYLFRDDRLICINQLLHKDPGSSYRIQLL